MPERRRRDILKVGGIAVASGLAGCLGGDDDGGDDGSGDDGSGDDGGGDDSSGDDSSGDDSSGDDGSGDDGSSPDPDLDSYSFQLATIHQVGGSYEVAASTFADMIAERTDGRIEVDVAPGGQFGTEPEQLEQLNAGAIDMVSQSACLPEALFIDPTYIICATFFHLDQPEWESYTKFRNESLTQLNVVEQLEEAGIKTLVPKDSPADGHFYGTYRGWGANDPLRSTDDTDGYSFSVTPADIMVAPLEGLGFEVQTIPPGEAVQAVQRGAVNGRESSPDQFVSSGLHEVLDYWMPIRHGMNASYLQMNMDTWSSLADQDQELVMETVLDAKAEADQINREAEGEHEQTMRDAGMEIVDDFDREDIFQAARAGLEEWFAQANPPITYDEAREMARLE